MDINEMRQPTHYSIEKEKILFSPRVVRTPGDLTAALLTARVSKGFSQVELARKIGVSQSAISLFEKGGGDLQFSTITRLLHAMGMEITIAPQKEAPEDEFWENSP